MTFPGQENTFKTPWLFRSSLTVNILDFLPLKNAPGYICNHGSQRERDAASERFGNDPVLSRSETCNPSEGIPADVTGGDDVATRKYKSTCVGDNGIRFSHKGSSGLEDGLENLGWETGCYELCPLKGAPLPDKQRTNCVYPHP